MKNWMVVLLSLAMFSSSCVTLKQYRELTAQNQSLEDAMARTKSQNRELEVLQAENQSRIKVLEGQVADLEAQIRQDATGLSEKKSVTLPIPMAYAAIQLTPLEWLVFEAEARGISYSGNSLYSLTGRVKWLVFGPVFVAAGYRYDKVEIDEEDIDADIEFSGPVFDGFKF